MKVEVHDNKLNVAMNILRYKLHMDYILQEKRSRRYFQKNDKLFDHKKWETMKRVFKIKKPHNYRYTKKRMQLPK